LQIRSLADNNLCIDTMAGAYNKMQLAMATCNGPKENPTQHQNFNHTYYRDIQYFHNLCFEISAVSDLTPIHLKECHLTQGMQFWRYDHAKKMIYKDRSSTICIDSDTKTKDIFINKCDETKINQKWEWGHINETMMADWEANGRKLL
jgi:Ricin-type beta-trefoil lectin domain